MKLLLWHARELRIESGVAGKKRKCREYALRKLKGRLGDALPALDDSNRIISLENALLALACVEKGDEGLDLADPRDSTLRSRVMLGVAEIVIAAFGHLSDKPADPMLAKRIVDEFFELIKKEHAQTVLVPFGWDKSLEMKVPLHHYNCAYKSFEPGKID